MISNQSAGLVLPVLFLLIGMNVCAQKEPVTFQQMLQMAETNYPLLKSKMLEVQAAQKGVNANISTLIPSLDASYQINYSTYNNIIGMAYPQFLVPISGPPSTGNNMNPVYGSAASLLFNWQPITFGQRNAQVDFAKAGLQYASADAQNEIFQHKIKVINAYLDLLTANELVKVYENNLKRTEVNLLAVQSLVISGIRPGVDTSVFKAEVSKSTIELLNSKKNKEQSHIYLTQLLASDIPLSFFDTLFFTRLPVSLPQMDSVKHPLVNLYKSSYEIGLARKKVLAKTMLPILGIWGTTYARGSGILYNGTEKPADGLGFQRYNYGIGIQLSIPLLQSIKIRSQLQQQAFLIQSNQEKLNEIELQLKKQNELADTIVNSAFAVVKESPLYLESAIFSYKALQSRYQSGLANIADLMQAQYALIKAETDNKLAYMNVWKAFLYKAAVNGNLNVFINQVNPTVL
jgi:outer membrane protein TolC